MSIPPKAWLLMCELDPNFLQQFMKARNNLKSHNDTKAHGETDDLQGHNKCMQPCKRGGTKKEPKPETCTIPKQYSAPAEKAVLCSSTEDDSDSSKDGYNTSNTDDYSGNEMEDSIDALYHSYNVIKDANCSFYSCNAFTTIMVQAHLEYKDCFAGISCNQHNHYIICDNGADTWVIGDGWTILDKDPIHTANIVAFDPAKMCKNGCLIVTAATRGLTVKDADGNLIMIVVCDAVLNKGSPISLCSKFQT